MCFFDYELFWELVCKEKTAFFRVLYCFFLFKKKIKYSSTKSRLGMNSHRREPPEAFSFSPFCREMTISEKQHTVSEFRKEKLTFSVIVLLIILMPTAFKAPPPVSRAKALLIAFLLTNSWFLALFIVGIKLFIVGNDCF